MFFHWDKGFILYVYSRFIADNTAIGNYIRGLSNLRAAKPAGCNRCADPSGDCTCRLKLLNQDSSCRLQDLSTESELSNEYVCI